MIPVPRRARVAAACLIAVAGPASAQVFGSLANFDAVNDTGYTAHGFEIRIEDPRYGDPASNHVYSIFGYDRDFGVPPTSVERYGAPLILKTPGVGMTIRYQANFANGAWSVGTPTGPYPLAGDSCWPLGNPQYASLTLTCDHFGVATYGTPAATSYHWLVDQGGNSGVLTPMAAGLPPVNFAYVPPAAPAPGQQAGGGEVQAEIEAHREAGQAFGDAYWVKIFSQKLDHKVELQNLMKGHPDVPDDTEIEAEFAIFQAGGENEVNKHLLQLGGADQALVLRYEFYRYQGLLKADGSVDCSGRKGQANGVDDCGGLGAYVGAQMAGFNVVQDPLAPGVLPPVAAVPEPGTGALLAGGLGLLGWMSRRRVRMQR